MTSSDSATAEHADAEPQLSSIRRSLTRIIIAALLPMGLFAGLLFYLLWDN